LEAFADGGEGVGSGILFDGEQEAGSEKEADLLPRNLPVLGQDHLGDEEKVFGVGFDFGALSKMEDVFEGKGVEGKAFSELLEEFGLGEAVEFDPEHGAIGGDGGELIDGGDNALLDVLGIVAGVAKFGREVGGRICGRGDFAAGRAGLPEMGHWGRGN
jgi:hypothetical protein